MIWVVDSSAADAELPLDPVLQFGQHDVHDGVDLETSGNQRPKPLSKNLQPPHDRRRWWRQLRGDLPIRERWRPTLCLLLELGDVGQLEPSSQR